MKKCEIDYFKKFRINLQLLRIEKGLSAEQLAVKIGASKKRITDFEYYSRSRKVKPNAEELLRLSKIFQVSVEDMIFKTANVIFNN